MKWNTGGIAEAITTSKAKGAIFVVYLEGKDEQSKNITSSFNNGELGRKLDNENFVAICVEAGSVPHQQFSEIFKEPSVPSIYFIGKSGMPLDIITGADNLENVSSRIDNILVKAGITVPKPAVAASESFIQAEQASSTQNNIVCEGDVCTIQSPPIASTSSEVEEQELSAEEKVERAKELLQKKKEEKETEEKEKERLKEVERRKLGQNVQKLKRWQEDQELKEIMEEREKEKRENQLARERVLAQIAQDRAERLSKTQTKPTPESSKLPSPSSSPRAPSNVTRLQFKLPDGSSNTQEFAISDSLQAVVTYIKTNLKLPFNFRLSTTFPRREFSESDYSQSLLDLELTPNAVILILPISHGTVSTNPGGSLTALVWSLFSPFFGLYAFLKNFIFGTNPNVAGAKRSSDEAGETSKAEGSKRKVRDSTVIRRQGNVHRLGDRRDSNDDGNTWNGNSTQQM